MPVGRLLVIREKLLDLFVEVSTFVDDVEAANGGLFLDGREFPGEVIEIPHLTIIQGGKHLDEPADECGSR